jgi:hypothetical protein
VTEKAVLRDFSRWRKARRKRSHASKPRP